MPVIWRGDTRLLDYGGEPEGVPLLVIPLLVNRAYVLDLSERHSFMRAMVVEGFHSYLIDWQAPGNEERKFDCTSYIAGRLNRLLDVVTGYVRRQVALISYCVGGGRLGLLCADPGGDWIADLPRHAVGFPCWARGNQMLYQEALW